MDGHRILHGGAIMKGIFMHDSHRWVVALQRSWFCQGNGSCFSPVRLLRRHAPRDTVPVKAVKLQLASGLGRNPRVLDGGAKN